VAPLDARSPPDVASRCPCRPLRQAARLVTFPVRPSPGVCSARQSVQAVPDVILGPPPVLSWAFPLQGSPMTRDGRAFALPPLAHFRRRLQRPESRLSLCPVPQSIPPRVMWLVSCETAVLPGVPSLFTLDVFVERAPPWLIVSPRGAVGVTATCRPSSGLACSDRSKMSRTLWARLSLTFLCSNPIT
jgi:hypothetical protein